MSFVPNDHSTRRKKGLARSIADSGGTVRAAEALIAKFQIRLSVSVLKGLVSLSLSRR